MASIGTSRQTSSVRHSTLPKKKRYNAVDPDIALEEMLNHDLRPLVAFEAAKVPWKSQCLRCDSIVQPTLTKLRNRGQRGCTTCQYAELGDNRRAPSKQTTKLLKSSGLRALEPYPGALKHWSCECTTCGNTVKVKANTLQQGKSRGCKHCSYKAQSLPHSEVAEFFRTFDLELTEEYPGNSATRLRCHCTLCGGEAHTSYKALKQDGTRRCEGCGFAGGLPANAPAVVYLVRHRGHHALKIGISHRTSARLRHHENAGWETLTVVEVRTVLEARAIEKHVLRSWRDAGFGQAVPRHKMRVGGFTETVSLHDVTIQAARRALNKAVALACDP